jgi:hypothetical protein
MRAVLVINCLSARCHTPSGCLCLLKPLFEQFLVRTVGCSLRLLLL